jgi:type II secretory pathway pseudopilin PulG
MFRVLTARECPSLSIEPAAVNGRQIRLPTDCCQPQGARGFTLIESLLASVVLAAAVIVVCSALAASMEHDAVAQERAVAASLARQLMEEISAKPLVDPIDGLLSLGPPSGQSSRSDFTNIGNYHGYTDQSNGIQMLDGSTVQPGGSRRYTRSVHVEHRLTSSGVPAGAGRFALVTVTATGPSGHVVKLTQLMANVTYE